MTNSHHEERAALAHCPPTRGWPTIFEPIAQLTDAVRTALPLTDELDAALAAAAKSSSVDADWLDAMRVVQHQLRAITTYLADVLRNAGPKPGRRRRIEVLKRRSRRWEPRLQDVHSCFCDVVTRLRGLPGPWAPSTWWLFRVCASDAELSVKKARLALTAASELLTPDTHYGFNGLWPRQPGHARFVHVGHFPELPFARDHALALIKAGTSPRDAVEKCAREHHVDAVGLAIAVGRALADQDAVKKDNEK